MFLIQKERKKVFSLFSLHEHTTQTSLIIEKGVFFVRPTDLPILMIIRSRPSVNRYYFSFYSRNILSILRHTHTHANRLTNLDGQTKKKKKFLYLFSVQLTVNKMKNPKKQVFLMIMMMMMMVGKQQQQQKRGTKGFRKQVCCCCFSFIYSFHSFRWKVFHFFSFFLNISSWLWWWWWWWPFFLR